ncbi:MAG TPA: dihydrodipicolinate synthase family protein [Euzebya sp.]|nr:dihydrodipicolinate synthase family protein [Euzebya sp.]
MAAATVRLPSAEGGIAVHTFSGAPPFPETAAPAATRLAFAAVHVTADPLATRDPGSDACIDWDATLAFRRHVWGLGLAVAEVMDTAQRGMGLPWAQARQLIERSAAEARAVGGRIACGIGTDQLDPMRPTDPDAVIAAYLEQLEVAEAAGAQPIVMASRALAACASGPDDYRRVYDAVLSQAGRPVVLHWLGAVFDPALEGYWGAPDRDGATGVLLDLVADHAPRIEGIKVSLLDLDHEVDLRRRVPSGVRVFSGDDFNFLELIRGDAQHHSDALLGIFDAAAPAAAAALRCLDVGDVEGYERVLGPVVPLSRLLFAAPTRLYKTGIVFLAHLNGHQDHFRMLGGWESARSVTHLADLVRLADAARLIADPELAAARVAAIMSVAGVDQG